MTDTPGPFHHYLCSGMYVAAGLAMASSGAMGLCGDNPGAFLALPGGLVVAALGSAVIRECRRQGLLDATVGTPVPAVERRPTATMRRSHSRLFGSLSLRRSPRRWPAVPGFWSASARSLKVAQKP